VRLPILDGEVDTLEDLLGPVALGSGVDRDVQVRISSVAMKNSFLTLVCG